MKFLIVDPDCSIVEAVSIGLELQWPDARLVSAADGVTGLERFLRERPDLTLLDVNLPDGSGWTMLREVRQVSPAPVIILTSRASELDKVHGLEAGADDYLTRPFSPLELCARMKAVLRRSGAIEPVHPPPAFVHGDLAVDFARRAVTLAGQPIALTPTEYNLLALLARNAGRVLPVGTLLTKVWGEQHREATDYLKTYISRLRHKLGDPPSAPRYILTERGTGYRFVRP